MLLALLLAPGVAAAEVVDRSVEIPSNAQLTQLVEARSALPTENRNAVAGVAGDLDKSGHLDVLVFHRLPEEPPFMFINDGHGQMRDEASTRLPTLGPGETLTAALVDLDGDGNPDIYIGRRPHDVVWLNDGHGVFRDATATWLPEAWGGTTDVAVGDVTGDGRPDLIVVQGSAVWVLENVGGHALRDITDEVLPSSPQGVTCVLLFDADADGALDLLMANVETLQLFLNDHGRFRAGWTQPNPQHLPVTGMAAGDLDGDGRPDVVMSRLGRPLVLVNRGNGQFASMPGLLHTAGPANNVVLADMNGDHQLDVILPMTGGNVLLLNPGPTGTWRPSTHWLPPCNEASRWAFVGDFNGDGLPDLYVATDGQDALYLQRKDR